MQNKGELFQDIADLEARTKVKDGDLVRLFYEEGIPNHPHVPYAFSLVFGLYSSARVFLNFENDKGIDFDIDLSANLKKRKPRSPDVIYIYPAVTSLPKDYGEYQEIEWSEDEIRPTKDQRTRIYPYQILELKILMPSEKLTKLFIEKRNEL